MFFLFSWTQNVQRPREETRWKIVLWKVHMRTRSGCDGVVVASKERLGQRVFLACAWSSPVGFEVGQASVVLLRTLGLVADSSKEPSMWCLGTSWEEQSRPKTHTRQFPVSLNTGCFRQDLFIARTSVYNINRHDWEHLAAKTNLSHRLIFYGVELHEITSICFLLSTKLAVSCGPT